MRQPTGEHRRARCKKHACKEHGRRQDNVPCAAKDEAGKSDCCREGPAAQGSRGAAWPGAGLLPLKLSGLYCALAGG